MTVSLNNYEEYAAAALEHYSQCNAASRYLLFEAVKDLEIKRVLDVGCGAGQELLPFLEKTDAFVFGVDIAPELGKITSKVIEKEFSERAAFTVSKGEELPFETASFDVVLCRVAIPYMNNKKAIVEFSRILKPNGVLLLKIHAPAFYFGMIRERIKTLNPKQIAYPLICLTASLWHSATGKQLENGFWQGKEIYQTRKYLKREFAKNNLKIDRELSDTNPQSPSFYIVKV